MVKFEAAMVEKHNYPYISKQYGINFKNIPLGFDGIKKSGSGRKLNIYLSEHTVEIEDVGESNYHMGAYINTEGILSLAIETRNISTGWVHPDFYAGKFVDFAVKHFEGNGLPIEKVQAWWTSESTYTSTNHHQFTQHFEATGNREEAARQTWTGKIIEKHGFTEIDEIQERKYPEENREEVKVVFSRKKKG